MTTLREAIKKAAEDLVGKKVLYVDFYPPEEGHDAKVELSFEDGVDVIVDEDDDIEATYTKEKKEKDAFHKAYELLENSFRLYDAIDKLAKHECPLLPCAKMTVSKAYSFNTNHVFVTVAFLGEERVYKATKGDKLGTFKDLIENGILLEAN